MYNYLGVVYQNKEDLFEAIVFWGLFIGTFIAWEPDKKEALKKENKNV